MSEDEIRTIAGIVGKDEAYRHFVRRINKEFKIADQERNTHVFVLYQKNKAGKAVGFAVVGHSMAKMKVWEETFKEEGWVDQNWQLATPCFELMYMYIRPEERKKGLGSKLFDKVMAFTTKQQVKAVYAYVGDRLPAALNFYKAKGARVIQNLSDGGISNAFLEWRLVH